MRLILLVCIFTLSLMTAFHAKAQQAKPVYSEAQRWMVVEEESGIIHETDGKTSQVPFQDFSAEIFFDPAALPKSLFLISFSFSPPGKTVTEEDTVSGFFQSSSVSKAKDGAFTAKGKLTVLGETAPAEMMLTASFVKGANPPKLMFDGGFVIPTRDVLSGDAAAYPAQMPVRFRFFATPLP